MTLKPVFFIFCVPSYISGVHHFWWDFCVCDHCLIQPLRQSNSIFMDEINQKQTLTGQRSIYIHMCLWPTMEVINHYDQLTDTEIQLKKYTWSQNVTTCMTAKQSHTQKHHKHSNPLSSSWGTKKRERLLRVKTKTIYITIAHHSFALILLLGIFGRPSQTQRVHGWRIVECLIDIKVS